MTTEIVLHRDMFAADRRVLLRHGAMSVQSFLFASGVAALEIDIGVARFVLLPFQGQQIWDARVGDRRLTMQSIFDAPIATRDFRRTYGAFFVHCGGTAIGSPRAGDDHMPHGELPNIPFDTASLVMGQAEGFDYIDLTGLAHDREAFSHAYAFRPRLRFFADSEQVHCRVEIDNIGGADMPLMYLGHVNFRPVAGARIVDAIAGRGDLHWHKPELGADASADIHAWHDAVSADFERHRQIGATDRVEPEFVLTMRLPADGDGWAHALQVLPDGSADHVSYRPDQLALGVRWMTRAAERQALGIILPSTATPDGRAAARAAGTLLTLAPGASFVADMQFGALSADAASTLLGRLGS